MPRAPSKASLVIETILKEKGLLDLDARVKKTEETLRRGEAAAGKFDDALTGLGRRFLATVSVGVLANFGKNLVAEFAQAERGINSIRHTMTQLGIDAEAHLPKVVAQIKEIVRAGDVEYGQGLSIFEKLLGLTRSPDAAQFLLDLSWKLSEAKSGTMDLGQAADFMASVLQGKAKQAARDLGIQWEEGKKGLEGNIALLDAIIKQYGTFGENSEDTQDKLDSLKGAWSSLKLEMSEAFGPSMAKAVAWFSGVLHNWSLNSEDWILRIRRAWILMKADFREMPSDEAVALSDIQLRLIEVQEGLAGGGKAVDDFADRMKAGAAEVRRILEENLRKQQSSTEKIKEDADGVLEAERRKAQEITDIINSLAAINLETLGQETQAVEDQEKAITLLRELSFARSVELAKDAADKKAAVRDLELFQLQQTLDTEIKILREAGATEVQIAEWVQYRKSQIDARGADKKKQTAWISNSWERRQDETNQQARARVAMQVFENTKAGAIASAFINLWQGITAIWKEWAPYPPVAAALTAVHTAMVLKQIKAIQKQKFASGFDDPANDAMAFQGGRRWARDMVDNFQRGAIDAGWREGLVGAGPVSSDNRTYQTSYAGPTINVRTTYLDRTGLHLLYRELQQIGRLEQARTVR